MINHVSYTIENVFYSTEYLYNEQFDDAANNIVTFIAESITYHNLCIHVCLTDSRDLKLYLFLFL